MEVIPLPRCKKQRCCRMFGGEIVYKPPAIPCKELQETVIELDEFEAMRLCDLEELDQTAAGERMGVSRGTVQRLLTSGRKKLIAALIDSKVIRIQNATEKLEED
jgi:Predicted DNA-binding proteins